MGSLCWLEWRVGGDEGGEMWVQLVRIGNVVASCCFLEIEFLKAEISFLEYQASHC